MFDAAIDYLITYRTRRREALNNKEKQRWFTSDIGSMMELFTDIFDSTTENQTWLDEVQLDKPDAIRQSGWRLKIAFLAGCRRDLREQFACDVDHKVRSPIHRRVFEYMRLRWLIVKAELYRRVLDIKCGA